MLAATTAGGILMAATTEAAHSAEPTPQPSRPGRGGADPGPRNLTRDMQNPDLLMPPSTDHGTLPNLRFSFSDAHMRLETGGWTRQVTVRELGISKSIAGVNMRLNTGGVRELHWHKAAEWAHMLYGSARITAIDPQGRSFVDDVGVGDLWYFPAGIPHSIQGLTPDHYSDVSLSQWLALTPPELVSAHLKLDQQVINALRKQKVPVVPA